MASRLVEYFSSCDGETQEGRENTFQGSTNGVSEIGNTDRAPYLFVFISISLLIGLPYPYFNFVLFACSSLSLSRMLDLNDGKL